jgi:predicted phage terminase large subunit-like protein
MNFDLNLEQYDAYLRRSLSAFTERSFLELHPGVQFLSNWHIELIADKLQAVIEGRVRRLIITVPPRNLKSIIASICAPAFFFGHYPGARVLAVSYSPDLALSLALSSRRLMESDFYRRLFGDVLLRSKNAVGDFHMIGGGSRVSTSVLGAITGRGADVIIIDDPLKPDDAISDGRRNGVNEWFRSTLYNRQNNKNTSGIVIIMQRLHEEDLAGFVQQFEDWEVVNLPAIATEDQVIEWNGPFGPRRYRRSAGGVLHPERESAETLEVIRKTMGENHFQAQYQQDPAPASGNLIKIDWFPRFDPDYVNTFDRRIISLDTANSAKELANFSVGTVWGIKDGKAYLVDVWRARVDYPELKKKVRELHDRYQPEVVLIEDKASGTQLIQELQREGIWAKAIKPKGDKIMRMNAQTAMIEGGGVLLPKHAPWLDEYMHELAAFPRGKFDDQVDSTAQALEYIQAFGNWSGAALFYLRENMRRRQANSGTD